MFSLFNKLFNKDKVTVVLYLSSGSKVKAVCSSDQWEDICMTLATEKNTALYFDNCCILCSKDVIAMEYR